MADVRECGTAASCLHSQRPLVGSTAGCLPGQSCALAVDSRDGGNQGSKKLNVRRAFPPPARAVGAHTVTKSYLNFRFPLTEMECFLSS